MFCELDVLVRDNVATYQRSSDCHAGSEGSFQGPRSQLQAVLHPVLQARPQRGHAASQSRVGLVSQSRVRSLEAFAQRQYSIVQTVADDALQGGVAPHDDVILSDRQLCVVCPHPSVCRSSKRRRPGALVRTHRWPQTCRPP